MSKSGFANARAAISNIKDDLHTIQQRAQAMFDR